MHNKLCKSQLAILVVKRAVLDQWQKKFKNNKKANQPMGFLEGKKCIWTAGFVCINWRYNINSSNAYKAVQLEQQQCWYHAACLLHAIKVLFDSSVAVDSVLLDFEGRRIQMGFCFQQVFWQTKQTGKIMCQSLCYLCHGQMSTAYKPAFYVHTLKSAHMKKSWLVVFSVAKLLDWEWKQPLLGGYHILSRSSANSTHLKTRRICNYQMGPGR